MDKMLPSFHLGFLSVPVVILAYFLLNQKWRRYRMKRQHGCKPIAKFVSDEFRWSSYAKEMEQAVMSSRYNALTIQNFERCGLLTFERSVPNEQTIQTADPLNHQAIVTQMDDWVKESRPAARPLNGDNIITQNGTDWRRIRNLVNPLFLRTELDNTQHFQLFVDRMIEQIPRDGSTIDMQPLIRRLFIDTVTDFIFGRSIDSLRDTTGEADEFIGAYDRATIVGGQRSRSVGFFHRLKSALNRDQKWLADCKVVHQFVDNCIQSHREAQKKASKHQKEMQCRIESERQRYILIDAMTEAIADPVDLRFQLLAIFSLGRETPSVVAGNTLFLLARNPEIWNELREQALIFKAKHDGTITFDQLMNLALFRYTVLETMRLHSPLPSLRRLAIRDTVLPRGGGPDGSSPAFVPKGTYGYIQKLPSWRDSSVWGEDVDSFRPSRFENRTLSWEFAPFSGGPRMCPANRQVVAQCVYMLYRLTLEFKSIENRDPCLEYVAGVMMCQISKNGSVVALKPAPAT